MAGARLLLADGEDEIRSMAEAALRRNGFEVVAAGSAAEALAAAGSGAPDLVVLDVALPDLDGFETCRRLRAAGHHVPVLFLTGRGGPDDVVRGLTLGGDDYLSKPFSLVELVARAHAVLRRSGTAPAGAAAGRLLRCGDLEMDDDAHRVTRAGVDVSLSPTEYGLLRYLLLNEGRVVSRAQILDRVWSYDFGGDGGVVETYIGYLRRKVEAVGPRVIHTVRGVGYTLRV